MLGCAGLERDNPVDPTAAPPPVEGVDHGDGASLSLSLSLPLPKALLSVIHRVVATLTAPGHEPVVKELQVSPLGPAVGTLGVLIPGEDRTLVLEGFDVEGNLIFSGRQTGIRIAAGDTTRVELTLQLEVSLPAEDDGNGADVEPDDGADQADVPSGDVPSGDGAQDGDAETSG